MSLNESIVEDAALEWFEEQSRFAQSLTPTLSRGERGLEHGPHLAPGEPAAERDSFSEVVLVGRLREASSRLNPAIPHSCTLATLRDTLLSGEIDVGSLSSYV
jgi:type I restriction enzyme, R subunit